MIKKITILSAFIISAVIAFDGVYNKALTNSNGCQTKAAGDPDAGGKTCNQGGCHTGFTVGTMPAGAIAVVDSTTNTATTTYKANTTYILSLTMHNKRNGTTSNGGGFQLTAENASGTHIGTFVPGTGSHIWTSGVVLPNYVTQTASSFAGTSKTWTVKWMSPSTVSGSVTFYTSFNVSNDDGTIGSDSIKTATFTLTSVGINEIENKKTISLAPNPATNQLSIQLANVAFTKATIEIYSIDGKLIFNQSVENLNQPINIADLNKGIYLLQVKTDKGNFVEKFVKE